MPGWTRRGALRSIAAAGALALAGCSGEASHSREVPRRHGERVPDPEVTFVRDADGAPLFSRDVDADGDDADGDGSPADDLARRAGAGAYLTGADDVEALAFADSPPADELRAFVDATDLESESVYLLAKPVGECYELALTGVFREDDGVDADFCRQLRPADVDCSADAEDTVGVAIRLPFPGDDFDSRGSGTSSDCRHRPIVAREGGGDARGGDA